MRVAIYYLGHICFGLSVLAGSAFLYADELFDPDSTLISKSLFLDLARAGNNVVAVGERGHIVVSSTGNQWKKINSGTEATLTAVFFLDQFHGWAVGHDAVILRTEDGGYSWQQVFSAPELQAPLLDIWFGDENSGIAIGAYGLYLTSNDGGKTWQEKELNVVSATDERENEDDLTELYDLHLNAISPLPGGNLVIAAEAGRIYFSSSGGADWRELPSPYSGSFFGVLPLADDSFAVFGLRGHMYLTPDNGNSWQQVMTHSRELLNDGIELDDGTILIVGMGGTLLVSLDGGKSVTPVEMPLRTSLSAISFKNNELVMAGDQGIRTMDTGRLVR